jgi:hypothetical protein
MGQAADAAMSRRDGQRRRRTCQCDDRRERGAGPIVQHTRNAADQSCELASGGLVWERGLGDEVAAVLRGDEQDEARRLRS